MIKLSSKSLSIVDIDEKTFNERAVALILQALLDSPHHIYLKFSAKTSNALSSLSNPEIQELVKNCKQKGCLAKVAYDFPIA